MITNSDKLIIGYNPFLASNNQDLLIMFYNYFRDETEVKFSEFGLNRALSFTNRAKKKGSKSKHLGSVYRRSSNEEGFTSIIARNWE